MWEERAYRARRDITALATEGLTVSELHAAAINVIEARVGTDLTCWATIDPETLVISTMTSGEAKIPSEYEPRLAEWRPLGLDQELRVMFLLDGACWGGAGLVRAGRDFTEREADFLAGVAPTIASATRLAVRSEASGSIAVSRPAIVVIGPRGELRALTPAGQEWRERLDQIAPGRFALMMHVMALGARSTNPGSFRTRLRDAGGQWASLEASPLIGADEDQIAVTIEPARGDQLISLLFAAYGLTAREREICSEVMAGHSTSDIASQLFISTNTVQDHLKSVFGKVGVRSRGELVARLRPNGSMP